MFTHSEPPSLSVQKGARRGMLRCAVRLSGCLEALDWWVQRGVWCRCWRHHMGGREGRSWKILRVSRTWTVRQTAVQEIAGQITVSLVSTCALALSHVTDHLLGGRDVAWESAARPGGIRQLVESRGEVDDVRLLRGFLVVALHPQALS